MDDWVSRRDSDSRRGWFDPNSGIHLLPCGVIGNIPIFEIGVLGSKPGGAAILLIHFYTPVNQSKEATVSKTFHCRVLSPSEVLLLAPVAQLEEGNHLKNGSRKGSNPFRSINKRGMTQLAWRLWVSKVTGYPVTPLCIRISVFIADFSAIGSTGVPLLLLIYV